VKSLAAIEGMLRRTENLAGLTTPFRPRRPVRADYGNIAWLVRLRLLKQYPNDNSLDTSS